MLFASSPSKRGRAALMACAAAMVGPSIAHASVVIDTNPAPAVEFHGTNYFVGGTGPFQGLYRSDGTAAGTSLVVRVPLRSGLTPWGLTVDGDHLAFSGDVNSSHPRYYVSDGTAAGTHRTPDPPARPPGRPVARMTDGGIFFVENSRDGDRLGYLPPGPGSPPVIVAGLGNSLQFGVLDHQVFFAGRDAAHGAEPWVSDGTSIGTHLVADLTPGPASSDVDYAGFAPVQDAMYVFAARSEYPSNVPHTPYLLTGSAPGTPVTVDGTPAVLPLAGAFRTNADALWFQTGSGADRRRNRVAAGDTVATQPAGVGFDDHGTILAPSVPLFVSENSLRATDAQGAETIIATTGLAADSKSGPEPAINLYSRVGDDVWFEAPAVDGGLWVLWRSDGTVAGTGPVVVPGQIDPVESALTADVDRSRDRRAPYRWRITGTVRPLGSLPVSAQAFCAGTVSISPTIYGRTKQLSHVHVPVHWNGTACTFAQTVTPPRRAVPGRRGKLTFSVQFDGTDHVAPQQHSERIGVRYG